MVLEHSWRVDSASLPTYEYYFLVAILVAASILKRIFDGIKLYGFGGPIFVFCTSRNVWLQQAKVLGTFEPTDALNFKQSVVSECSMIATSVTSTIEPTDLMLILLQSALIASANVSALSLRNLGSAHWFATGFVVWSLVLAIMAVYYSVRLQRRIGRLSSDSEIRQWIRGGSESYNQQFVQSFFRSGRFRLDVFFVSERRYKNAATNDKPNNGNGQPEIKDQRKEYDQVEETGITQKKDHIEVKHHSNESGQIAESDRSPELDQPQTGEQATRDPEPARDLANRKNSTSRRDDRSQARFTQIDRHQSVMNDHDPSALDKNVFSESHDAAGRFDILWPRGPKDQLIKLSFTPSFTAVVTVSAPQKLFEYALYSLLIALGIYFGLTWTQHLDGETSTSASRNIFIFYMVILVVGLCIYSISGILQNDDPRTEYMIVSDYCERWLLDPNNATCIRNWGLEVGLNEHRVLRLRKIQAQDQTV